MKIYVSVQIETTAGNKFVSNPSFGEKLQTIFHDQKAESVYFFPRNGHRGITYVTEVTDGAKVPSIAEPWWMLGACNVEMTPCFTPQDMQKAMPEIMSLGKKYGG